MNQIHLPKHYVFIYIELNLPTVCLTGSLLAKFKQKNGAFSLNGSNFFASLAVPLNEGIVFAISKGLEKKEGGWGRLNVYL